MAMLARWAGWLAIAGGALMAIILVMMALSPESPAATLFFGVVVLLAAGVLGLYERTKSAVGQLGRVSAWLSALGGLGLLLVGAYGIATNQFTTDPTAPDPLLPFWIITSLAWLGGSIAFAAMLIRARALSVLGAWLVVAGAVGGLVASIVGGQYPPPAVFLVFGLAGVGWILLGYAATRQAQG